MDQPSLKNSGEMPMIIPPAPVPNRPSLLMSNVWALSLAGASIIFLMIVAAVDRSGFYVLISALIMAGVFLIAHRSYVKRMEASQKAVNESSRYAHALEERTAALRDSEQRFRSAFKYAPIGIALVSPDGRWVKVNKALCDILGYTPEEFLSMHVSQVIFPDDLAQALASVDDLITGRAVNCQMEQRYIHKSGWTVWASWSASAASEAWSEAPHLIFQIQDITDRKVAEEQLQHEATHDALTGLPNRAYFVSRLTKALAKAKRDPKYSVSVLFIDLDRFKYVNDSLGHFIGDNLLMAIADRLGECMRPPDIIARLGGDEFTILVEGRYYTEKASRIAERIQEKFSEPFQVHGHEIYSSASIGILVASDRYDSAEDIMRDADTAMYYAKRAGRARHETFDEYMHLRAKETLRLETDLRRALERNEVQVRYQPIYDLRTMKPTGVEALARWTHPELGDISPSRFIPLAEETGLIDEVLDQVMRRACLEMREVYVHAPNGDQLKLSVNLSCRQFAGADLLSRIRNILDETGYAASQLKLEITESVFIEYQERAIEMLHKIREMGIELDIDDFGTGYSNLSYLVRLPISTLKIDRSFVCPINDDGANIEIVRTILALARNLGLTVVAEGIETEEQVRSLIDLDCERGQGFLLSKPLTAAGLKELLDRGEETPLLPMHYDDISTVSTLQ